MRSFELLRSKFGIVAVGLGLILPIAACAVVGEDSESSSADFSGGRPGRGRPPGQPVLADEDAAPPAPPQPSIIADDGGTPRAPEIADQDAGEAPPPATDEDAGEAPPPVIDPPPPPVDEDAGP